MSNRHIDKPHKLTNKERSKGGKRSSISKKLVNRKHCNSSCPIFCKCPLSSFGVKHDLCYLSDSNGGGGKSFRTKILKLISGDRDDLLDVMASSVANIIRCSDVETDTDPKMLRLVVDSMEKLHNMRFGRTEHIHQDISSNEPLRIEFVTVDSPDDVRKFKELQKND